MSRMIPVACAVVACSAVSAGLALAAGGHRAAQQQPPAHAVPAITPTLVSGQTLFAVVRADGTLLRRLGVLRTGHPGTGRYDVVFKRGLRRCAFTATIGFANNLSVPAAGFVAVNGLSGLRPGVFVATYDSSGAPADMGFHLVVACPPL